MVVDLDSGFTTFRTTVGEKSLNSWKCFPWIVVCVESPVTSPLNEVCVKMCEVCEFV